MNDNYRPLALHKHFYFDRNGRMVYQYFGDVTVIEGHQLAAFCLRVTDNEPQLILAPKFKAMFVEIGRPEAIEFVTRYNNALNQRKLY
jgi:hypothetical protein